MTSSLPMSLLSPIGTRAPWQRSHPQIQQSVDRRSTLADIGAASLVPACLHDENGNAPTPAVLAFEITEAGEHGEHALFAQRVSDEAGRPWLLANDRQGRRFAVELGRGSRAMGEALEHLQAQVGRPVRLFPHGALTAWCRGNTPPGGVRLALLGYPPIPLTMPAPTPAARVAQPSDAALNHLARLEAEAIHIIREAVAQSERPAMLYSIGKDSSVMLHLAAKAFHPGKPPFPLVHIDTRWKFREMYLFRDQAARAAGLELIVHINPDAIAQDINPFDHGSELHTRITKTEGLKQALQAHRFDLVFGGARRDEEKSRAKERVFSFRSASHRWDPRNQRPELWNLYNARIASGESIRVFPLSNWTEADVWAYIHREDIPIVPLYFARERPVVVRNGFIMMVDDARARLAPDERIERRSVRFRTLGCYPLTGAIESEASSVADILLEVLRSRNSERQGRAIDSDSNASMERKKQEGYF